MSSITAACLASNTGIRRPYLNLSKELAAYMAEPWEPEVKADAVGFLSAAARQHFKTGGGAA